MSVGIVAIGRNEGERLRACLRSLSPHQMPVVYVDSGSTDGSPVIAAEMGATVVPLDLSIPFTAARARNVGWRRLLEDHPDLEFIQFVDGDCEVDPTWLPTAMAFLQANPAVVVVCGRRKERYPEATVYNHLCDIEWNTPVGDALACGGDALFRVAAIQQAGGYRDSLIAGEEPELCVRLREHGGRVYRLDAAMTTHDAAMTRFRQWWKRHVRAGHAFAEVSALHANSPCRIWHKEVRSNDFWGIIVPLLAIIPAYFTYGLSTILLLGYGVLWAKITRYRQRCGDTPATARMYAWYCVLSKFPQAWGQLTYRRNRLFRRRSTIIEYKTTGPVS